VQVVGFIIRNAFVYVINEFVINNTKVKQYVNNYRGVAVQNVVTP